MLRSNWENCPIRLLHFCCYGIAKVKQESLAYSTQFNSCPSRPDVYQCLVVQTSLHNISEKKPSTSKTHVACNSKLRSVVRSSMHLCQGNWVAIMCAAVYYSRAVHALGTRIRCCHCTCRSESARSDLNVVTHGGICLIFPICFLLTCNLFHV